MKKWTLDENDVIFSTEDPEGRSIYLTKTAWKHIKDNHHEITITVPITKTIIQNPGFITENLRRGTLAYTQVTSISLYYNIYVKMDDTFQKGTISTAFLGGNLPKGGVIWTGKQ